MKFKNYVAMSTIIAIVLIGELPLHADDAGSLYKTKCAICHGADGKGDTPAGKRMGVHDFAGADVQKMSDSELTGAITDGKNKMPAYKKSLSADQIKDLVAYIRTLKK
jgi:mono/diheme cytochrome c family protein